MQYKKSDFYYDLPEELIAQTPAEPRDSSRLLVYDRKCGKTEHKIFKEITEYLHAGDVLVVNNTRVLPARLYAHTENGGAVEVLLLKRLNKDEWEVLVKPGKKCQRGRKLKISDELSLTVEDITESGERIVRFEYDGVFASEYFVGNFADINAFFMPFGSQSCIEVVERRQAVHEDNVFVSCAFEHIGCYFIRCKKFYTFRNHSFFTHGSPYIRVDNIGIFNDLNIIFYFDSSACFFADCFYFPYYFAVEIINESLRTVSDKVHSHLCTAVHPCV